jgi:15-cis-phytoene synthase
VTPSLDSAGVPEPVEAVRAAAREGEPDRYAAALLAPAALQSDLLALAAFAAEVGRVPMQVREPMMGELRLQWWHDAIDDAAKGRVSGHPVADALGATIRRCGLDTGLLNAAVEARLFDLGRGVHADDAGLGTYLEATEGSIFELGLAICGLPVSEHRRTIARASGRAYGLARALVRVPALLDKGGFPMPENRLIDAQVTPEMLVARPPTAATVRAVGSIAEALETSALRDLQFVRQAREELGVGALPALLPLALFEPYFVAQHRNREFMLVRTTDISPLGRLWRLWRASRRGQI